MAENMVMPTTSAQVSGHKFLVRRIEHGLVMGDVRMIHDPLSRRRRALVFGAVACALIAVGSLALAVFRPAIDPGDAPLIRADSGALYVRLEEQIHPVANLASARLILGEPAEPVRASDQILGEMDKGVPVGLPDAPGVFSSLSESHDSGWFVCQEEQSGHMHVWRGVEPAGIGEGKGWLGASKSESGALTWHLIDASGRRALPDEESAEGRIVRRHLGITAQTPRLYLGTELLNAIPERTPIRLPNPQPELVDAGPRSWLRTDAGLAPITALQRAMLIDAGSPVTTDPTVLLGLQREVDVALHIPGEAVTWEDVDDSVVCANGKGALGQVPELARGVHLSGDSRAQTFISEAPGAVGADSGFGYYVVSDVGVRHAVADGEAMNAMGLTHAEDVPWTVLQLLPTGSELSRESALAPAY